VPPARPTVSGERDVLRFAPDGLVLEQRDAWNQAEGRRQPPEGLGA
jgi:hypothetical protein